MREAIVQNKKEVAAEAGLDPSTTKCSVSTQWAKIGMTVTAAASDQHQEQKLHSL